MYLKVKGRKGESEPDAGTARGKAQKHDRLIRKGQEPLDLREECMEGREGQTACELSAHRGSACLSKAFLNV